ncbi:MAG: hypothetical protein JJU02_16755 [Cryomorphaceae bacterium]|nr:hypothetical protein [Cryomorphaceae bacterium]
MILSVILWLSCTLVVVGAKHDETYLAQDTVLERDTILEYDVPYIYDEENDFAPGLFVFVMVGAVFFIASFVLGLILTIFCLLLLAALVFIGVFSTSILVGLARKSWWEGIKTFFVFTTSITGGVGGAVLFFTIFKILHWPNGWEYTIMGGISGALAGMAYGLAAFYLIRAMADFFRRKLNSNRC